MGIFDSLKHTLKAEATKAVSGAVHSAGTGKNRSEEFTFEAFPKSLDELQALPEASLDSPFKAAALSLAVLCHFGEDPEVVFAMLDFLKGPDTVSTYEKQFLTERLKGKEYKPFSFFHGATPENSYCPSAPYTVTVYENPYSFDNENWATLWVKSSGGDNLRSIKLRKKPSTGQWFVNDIQYLADIRIPTADDPWA